MPLKDLSEGPRTTNAPVPEQEECEAMFDKYLSSHKNDPKNKLSDDEQQKLKTSFKDPKFREMLADYMEEISDPKYREETEQYISQMEADDQVPKGKELVRPEACFVVKTHIVPFKEKDNNDIKGDKIFINIVQSEQIAKPIGEKKNNGIQWSLPISLGPKRFESDKGGEALIPTFDACFHPDALKMVRENKSFRDYLVHTAIDQVQSSIHMVTKSNDIVKHNYHVLRGVTYKNGKPAIMMMASDKMSNIQNKSTTSTSSGTASSTVSQLANKLNESKDTPPPQSNPPSNPKKKNKKTTVNAEDGAVKKGFLNSGSTSKTTPPKPQPPKAPSLISEISPCTSTTSSKPTQTNNEKQVINKMINNDTSTMSGEISPTYHMKERGSYRLSDSMNTRVVQPSRPTELDVIIELPSLATKSNMDLDVSTDKLKFTALRSNPGSSYKLELKLPYPCEGEKGKAKFDKVRKELKVTIPVVAPKYVDQGDVIGSIDSKSPIAEISSQENSSILKNSQNNEIDNNEEEENQKLTEKEMKIQARNKMIEQQQAKLKEGKVDHSKWVQPLESNRMNFDIPEGAKLIAPTPIDNDKTINKTDITSQSPSTISKIETNIIENISNKNTNSRTISTFSVKFPFTESNQFMGYVPDYVFKLGEFGLGYYCEVESKVQVEDQIAPYEFKQLNEVLTILVQVPKINKTSVSMTFSNNDKKVLISFMAPSCQINENINNKIGLNNEIRYILILNTFDCLNTKKCRFDVADKNMILVLYKLKEELWETPLLSVESEEYQTEFTPLYQEINTVASSNSSHSQVEVDLQLAASLDSIEKSAAQKSMDISQSVPPSVISQKSKKSENQGSKVVGNNDVVAPTSFQNTIMFELD